jgi:TolB-like protein
MPDQKTIDKRRVPGVSVGLIVLGLLACCAYFKGKPAKIDEMARELAVPNVLEGSVRKSSDRVRMTAQLVSAATGFNLCHRPIYGS